MTPQAIDASIASDKAGIMASVNKGDLPAKTGAAREFLVNSLKVGDDYPSTTLTDVMSAPRYEIYYGRWWRSNGRSISSSTKVFWSKNCRDDSYMVEATEEIAIFTKRVMDNVEDAKGLKT